MADAVCGPSNPLQQFRKAAQADRTLQQDRLVNRGSPTQGFRSSPGPSARSLDPEFEAFQAGLPAGPALQDPRHFPPQALHPGPIQSQSQLPAWASDFQALHIGPQPSSSLPVPALQQVRKIPSAQGLWQQDFLRQQSQAPLSTTSQPQSNFPANPMFGGVPRYGMFNQASFEPSFAERPEMSVSQGKQREGSAEPQWDDEAFARAFDQAHEAMISSQDNIAETQASVQAPVDLATQEMQVEQAEQAAEAISKEYEPFETTDLAMTGLAELVQRNNEEARAYWQSTRQLYDLNDDPLADQHDILDAIEAEAQARAQSELQTLDLSEAKQDPQPVREVDADDLSRTAGQLLDSVANDTSDKFQNSSFLALMRKLRDREVRVEGDKMVEVRDLSQSSSSATFESLSAVSSPVSEMSLLSSSPVSMASSQTSYGAAEVEMAEPTFPTTVPPYMSDWVDGEGVRHRHSWPANAERCKHHGCSEVQGHVYDEWSDIADTNADAD